MAANESQEISMQRAGGSEHDYRGSSPRSMERVRSEEEIEKDAKVEGHKKFMYVNREHIGTIIMSQSMNFKNHS